jgi:hypothetical protein
MYDWELGILESWNRLGFALDWELAKGVRWQDID